MAKRRPGLRPQLLELDDRCLPSGFVMTPDAGYPPTQIAVTYGLNAITFPASGGTSVKGDGTGETIALIEENHDPNIQSDLATFDTMYGLPRPPKFTVIDQSGGQTDSGWALEESMDVEWSHAIAPGANILVVEAAPGFTAMQELSNLMTAVNTASSTPGVTVVSMSWGFREFPGETAFDSNFTAPGITYVAASGDNSDVEYPAGSPEVLSVGGTSLRIGAAGDATETAWYASGGGYSQFEAEPGDQRSVQTTGQRSTPDVAFDGNPNTGAAVYETGPTSGQGSWQVVGGTSLGAPSWAGIIAIAD
jgi:subtilase family serine protease